MTHPTSETLAAFAGGNVDAQTRADVLAHLDSCNDCMTAALSATAFLSGEAVETRPRRWWIAAAAAIVVIAIAAVPLMLRSRSGVARLVALAPRDERVVEPRLTGGFAYAPYRGPMRANDTAANAERLKLGGAAGEAIERAQRDASSDAQRAAAIALVLIDRPAEAIDRLQREAKRSPNDARAWSDLAAARYAAAVDLRRPSLLPEALAAADRALHIDPQSHEALFNRALILASLGLSRDARAAWERYLAADSSSPWANEARERLSKLPAQTRELRFQKELPRLERAALTNDAATVKSIVAQFPQQTRLHAEAESLGSWGAGDERALIVARAIGGALTSESLLSESLLHEAVAAIDHADAEDRAALAEAHVVYRRGRIAYAKQQLEAGERDLRDAASRFAAAHSPMSFPARYYAASALYDRHEVTAACAEQAKIRDELASRPRYAAMRAQVPWAIALCHMIDGDWFGALPFLTESENGFRALGERSNLGFVLALTASTYTYMGRADDAWAARIRGFEALSGEGRGSRLAVALGAAARSELREGRLEAARAMMQLEEAADRATANAGVLVDALTRQAVLAVAMHDDASAVAKALDAGNVARSIRDPGLRARAIADVDFANGAIALRADPSRARELLTSAIGAYSDQSAAALLPEAYLLRARASIALHDAESAMLDLEKGIESVERQHAGDAGHGVLHAASALYEEAIRLELDRGDPSAALAYAERKRGRSGFDLASLEQRLAHTRTTIVEYAVLGVEVVAFTIDERGVRVTRTPMTMSDDLAALHDILIAPLQLDAQMLIIVPDSHLENVPFAALYDRRAKQYLVERMPVSIALSASSLQRSDARAPRSVLAVALPAGSALPQAEREMLDVRALYRESSTVPPAFAALVPAAAHADVVHIAGHTDREPGAGDAALVFTDERVAWKRVAREPLFNWATRGAARGPTVVLAACETMRAPRDPESHALSLGGGFLASGAASVIGTLTPIADRDAHEIFTAIHRELAAGTEPAGAVRSAQLAAIARGDAAWKSIALLTRCIPTGDSQEASHGRDHDLLRRNLHAHSGPG